MKYVTAIMTAPGTGQVLRSEVYNLEDLAECRLFKRDMLVMAMACGNHGWALRVVRSLDMPRDRCAVAEDPALVFGGKNV